MKFAILVTSTLLVSSFALAQSNTTTVNSGTKPSAKAAGKTQVIPQECQPIYSACTGAGFIQGAWKAGDGLWRDCIDPIMKGATTVKGATKPLPQVNASDVTACKTKHPRWGEGQVGS